MYNITRFVHAEEVDMRSSNVNSPSCPDGYRRYVYSINIKLPFKIKFPTEPLEHLPDASCISYDINYSPPDDIRENVEEQSTQTHT